MDVQGVGPRPAETGLAAAAREAAPSLNADLPAAAAEGIPRDDSVAALLRELSQTDPARLLGILENAPAPADQEQAETLQQAVVAACAAQNPGRALELLKRLALLDPTRAEALASDPSLAPLHTAVERLLSQLAAAAKLNAEGRLTEAGRLLESGAGKEVSAREMKPEVFLLVATRLLEAGGLANHVRSAAVSGAFIEQCGWVPAFQAEPVPAQVSGAHGSLLPLGFLFLAWLVLGMAGVVVWWWLQYDHAQVALELWGGGLLGLIGLAAWRHRRTS